MGGGLGSKARVVPLGALAVLIALAGIGVLVTQPSTAASPAVLEVIEPAVEVQAEPRYGFSEAGSGDSVTEGSVIRTDRAGVAAITYEDGSLTRIGPATTYQLVTLRTEEGRREIIGKLDTGQTFHRVSKVTGSASRFEVQTSDAVAAVRGTEFAVQCIVLDICEFGVTEGTVTVRSSDGRAVDVTAGHRVTVDGDGNLGELKLLSQNDPWIARNAAEPEPATSPAVSDQPDEEPTAATASESSGDGQFRSWGGVPVAMSGSESEAEAEESADEEGSSAEDESTAGSQQSEAPTTASTGPTETTGTSETTTSTTSESTTTTTEPATTTTTGSDEGTTTTTTSGDDTTTTSTGDATTTTTTSGEGGTSTSTTSGGGDGTTTSTTSGGSDDTTSTTAGDTTTPSSEQTTTTTGPCPEGEEPVEGRGCRPKCPHDRPRDPNGNCRRECPPGDQSEECQGRASSSSRSSRSKAPAPFLWIFSFLFGGTVLARRAPDRWDD